eukprot:PRCOL_00000711-RA
MARKDGTPAMRARTEYAYSTEVYGTLQRMLAKLLEAMPEKPLHYMPADEEAEEVEAAPAKIEGKNIIFVLGGPGSGKGTQCERIVADFGFDHFSAGDLLRAEVTSGSEVGIMCANLMKEGKLVPASVTMGLLRKSIEASTASAILVDGFPRALDQSTVFEKTICDSKFTLYFDCPEETMTERLLKRAETSGRADDNTETIKKRFGTFQLVSLPVVEHYEKQNKVHKISSVPAPDDVYADVKEVLVGAGFAPKPSPGHSTLNKDFMDEAEAAEGAAEAVSAQEEAADPAAEPAAETGAEAPAEEAAPAEVEVAAAPAEAEAEPAPAEEAAPDAVEPAVEEAAPEPEAGTPEPDAAAEEAPAPEAAAAPTEPVAEAEAEAAPSEVEAEAVPAEAAVE